MPRLFAKASTDRIRADGAHLFSQQSPYAVAFWTKAPQQPSPNAGQNAFCEGRSSSSNPFLLIGKQASNNSKKLIIVCRDDAGGTSDINTSISTPDVFDSTWHHFIFTQDGAATCHWQSYIDGVVDKNTTYTSAATTIDELGIGIDCRSNGAVTPFDGTIAHLATWSRQLSATEAKALAAGISPLLLGANHYWPLFGIDSPEPDIGRSSHTAGTLTGTTVDKGGKQLLHLLDF